MANKVITEPYLKQALTNVKTYIDNKSASSGSSVTVDTTLTDTGTNPVQGKAVKEYVDNIAGVKIVDALPDTGVDNVIYAVKKQSAQFIYDGSWKNGYVDTSVKGQKPGSGDYFYMLDDGKSPTVGDYVPESVVITLDRENIRSSYTMTADGGITKYNLTVLYYNAADNTYIVKDIRTVSDSSIKYTDKSRDKEINSQKIEAIFTVYNYSAIKVVDDVLPPYTYDTQVEYQGGFVLRKTTFLLYTYNNSKWKQLSSKLTTDLLDTDNLKAELKAYADSKVVTVEVDSDLSLTSKNPVQNKIVTEQLNKKAGKLILRWGSELKVIIDAEHLRYDIEINADSTLGIEGIDTSRPDTINSADVYIKNAGSSEITVTIPNDYISNTHSFKMAAGSYIAATVCYSGKFEKYIVNIGSALS